MTDENNASNEINEANEEKKVSIQKRKSTNRRGNYLYRDAFSKGKQHPHVS